MIRDRFAWFVAPPDTGFYIRVDPTSNKPYVVVERFYGGYRKGVTQTTHGSYRTAAQAKRRIRFLESR